MAVILIVTKRRRFFNFATEGHLLYNVVRCKIVTNYHVHIEQS